MTNSEIRTLAIELYKLASENDTISSEKAEQLIKSAISEDKDGERKDEINIADMYSKYPQLQDRLTDDVERYFELPYKNITVFTRGKLTFGILHMNKGTIEKLASFINRRSGMIHKYEDLCNEFIWSRHSDNMHKSMTRVYNAFDEYLRGNGYTEMDLVERFENEFKFIDGMVD